MKSQFTLLLCEDDEFLSRMYTYKLEIEGYKVVVVNSGEKVIPQAKVVKPDLIILDLIMPVQNGFEILSEIFKGTDTLLKNIPIIVASNLAQQTDIDTVKKLGAVDFIGKLNTSPSDLVAKVRTYLPT